jgi:PAS domain S-box-containing protein
MNSESSRFQGWVSSLSSTLAGHSAPSTKRTGMSTSDVLQTRLPIILGNANIATWVYDIAGDAMTADDTLARLFDVAAEHTRGGRLSEYTRHIHPRDLPRVEELLARAIEQRGAYDAQYRVVSSGGEVRWVLARGFVEVGPGGEPATMPGVVIDVTEWKRLDQLRLQFTELTKNSADLIAVYSLSGFPTYINPAGLLTIGAASLESIQTLHLAELFCDEDKPGIEHAIRLATGGSHIDTVSRLRHLQSGALRWIAFSAYPLMDEDGVISALAVGGRDVTDQKRAEQSLALENKVLEQIAQERPLADILEHLALQVEAASLEEMLVSVLLLDESGEKLLHGAAPSLPPAYNEAIHGLSIGPGVGSCGTAAATGQPVFVEDLSRDERWAPFVKLVQEHGLAACSSLPIRSLRGDVLGTIAMYYRTPRLPGEHDRALMETARHLAGIIIERQRAQAAIQRNEEQFSTLANTIPQLAWTAGPDGGVTWYNDRWFEYTGTTMREMEGWGWQRVHDPAVVSVVVERWTDSVRTGTPFEMEFPIRGADGVFRTFLTRVEPIRDDAGNVLRWFGTSTNIDEQRRSVDRTKKLVEATSQAIWTASAKGLVSSYSPSWGELTGQGEREMSGLGWLEAIYGPDRPRVSASWQHSIHTGEHFSEQFRVWSVHNRFLHIRAKGVPLMDREGNILEWIVANTDVTEQVEAQQQLRERASYAAFRASLKEIFNADEAVEETLLKCCNALISQLGLAAGLVWRLNGESNLLELRAHAGAVPPLDAIRVLACDGNEIGRLAHSDRPHLNNAVSRSLELPIDSWIAEQKMEALVGHAVLLDGNVEGVLVGLSRSILPVNITDEIRDAADGLGSWLKRKRIERQQTELLGREQRARLEAEKVLSLAEHLATETTLKGLVQIVTDVGTDLTGAAFGAFFYNTLDERGESYMLYTISGVPAENFSKFPMPRATAVFAPTFAGEGTVRSDDILADPRYGKNDPYFGLPKGHLPVRSYLAVPVKRKTGEVVGGLFFGDPDVGRFSEHHARLAESIAAHAAFGFDRSPLQ